MAIQNISCETMEAFNSQLQALHRVGYVNAGHHAPNRLNHNEYLICTHQQCRCCANSTGLSIVWQAREERRDEVFSGAHYSRWPRRSAGTTSS